MLRIVFEWFSSPRKKIHNWNGFASKHTNVSNETKWFIIHFAFIYWFAFAALLHEKKWQFHHYLDNIYLVFIPYSILYIKSSSKVAALIHIPFLTQITVLIINITTQIEQHLMNICRLFSLKVCMQDSIYTIHIHIRK